MKDILVPLQDLIVIFSGGNRVNAIQGEEYDCAARAFTRSSFDPYCKLDVIFVDVDQSINQFIVCSAFSPLKWSQNTSG